MTRALLTTSAFERDLRHVRRQGKDLDKLEMIVDLLQSGSPMPSRCRVHPMRGEREGHWDCHVEPDSVLFHKLQPGELILVRTGSHSELFAR